VISSARIAQVKTSAYVPCFNNAASVLDAVRSLQGQSVPPDEIFVVDDGSTDGSADLVEAAGFRVHRQSSNLGRGAARHAAMQIAKGELVLCCDASNRLSETFLARAKRWFEDAAVGAVFGLIQDPHPVGAANRWRARHLFKQEDPHVLNTNAALITFGAVLRAKAVHSVGGFDVALRHSEDGELGSRLTHAGYQVVSDPTLEVFANVQNSLVSVLERYWRWYVGKDEEFTWRAYLRATWYAARTMAWSDLRKGDPDLALISLILPHYQMWRRLRS
jgi:glycosyltransferase involved in cell wall biosynthesis